MKRKQLITMLIILSAIGLFVQTNADSIATINQTSNEGNDTALIVIEQLEENLVTDDIIINKTDHIQEENASVDDASQKEQDESQTKISPDNEAATNSEEDFLNNLQPQLPGPKPPLAGGDSLTERGPIWERTCTEDSCSLTLYSQQRYYQDTNNQWIPLDEHFYSTPCASTYAFCVTDNLYQVHMKSYPDTTDPLRFTYQDLSLHFTPADIHYSNQQRRQSLATVRHSPSQVSDNRAHYPGAFASNIDLAFTYYPRLFKEELILQTRQALPAVNLSGPLDDTLFTFSSTFTLPIGTTIYVEDQLWDEQTPITTQRFIEFRTATTSVYLTPPLAYDAHGITTRGTYLLEREDTHFIITTAIPYLWLINTTRAYPVHVDPTITLDYTNILWDGNILYDPAGDAAWSRNGVASTLTIGDVDRSPDPGFTYSRADLDWDISVIPDLAQLETIQLNLYFEFVDTTNDEVRFYPMVGGNSHYPDDDTGNNAFYDDMGDGTEYERKQAVVSSLNTFNITNASQNLQTFLMNGTDTWSIGIRSEESGSGGDNASYFTSSEGITSANRPTIEIIYTSAKPAIELLSPANASVFDKFGNIIIQFNVTDQDNDLLKVTVFGSNISQPDLDDLLFKQENVTTGTILNYNWTTFVTDPTANTKVLLHFDNQNEFDENATQVRDFSGNEMNATCSGASCPSFNITGGKIAGAFEFDSINDYFSTVYTENLNRWTISVWVKSPASPTTTSNQGPVHREKNYQINWDHFNTAYQGSVALSVNSVWYGASFGELLGDTWYHLAGTYDGENLKAYKDGMLITTNSSPSGDPDAETAPLSIGRHALGTFGYFNGTIDEVVIYNYALSDEEIMNLYRLHSGNYYFFVNVSDGIEDAQSDTYTFTLYADEFEARKASERGIRNATTNAPLFIDSQVYTGDTSNNQQLGRFDTFTQDALQNYAFNYITEGETATNMNSFDSNIYFLDIFNLTGDSITEQVSSFITERR